MKKLQLLLGVFVVLLSLGIQGFAATDEQLGNKADALEKKQSKPEEKKNEKDAQKDKDTNKDNKSDNYKVDVSGQDTKNYPASDWKK